MKEVEVEETAKLSKRAKKKAREEQEAAVRKAELAKLQDAPPESTEDFERLVLGSPNSSYLWIRYMAFLLGMAEVTKARDVAERALKTIDLRCALLERLSCQCVLHTGVIAALIQ